MPCHHPARPSLHFTPGWRHPYSPLTVPGRHPLPVAPLEERELQPSARTDVPFPTGAEQEVGLQPWDGASSGHQSGEGCTGKAGHVALFLL